MNAARSAPELPPALYLGLPALVVLVPYSAQWIGGRQPWLYGESGAIEWATVLFLLVAIYQGARVWGLAIGWGTRWLSAWAALLLAGTVYFAGEELSWGQHAFQWTTPEEWRRLNDQGETNLHNVHSLFDQLPRALLTAGALVGGVIVPLYRRFSAQRLRILSDNDARAWPYWLWPTWACLPVSIAVLAVSPFDRLVEAFGAAAPDWLYMKGGELKECLLALFILTYLASLRRRLRTSTDDRRARC